MAENLRASRPEARRRVKAEKGPGRNRTTPRYDVAPKGPERLPAVVRLDRAEVDQSRRLFEDLGVSMLELIERLITGQPAPLLSSLDWRLTLSDPGFDRRHLRIPPAAIADLADGLELYGRFQPPGALSPAALAELLRDETAGAAAQLRKRSDKLRVQSRNAKRKASKSTTQPLPEPFPPFDALFADESRFVQDVHGGFLFPLKQELTLLWLHRLLASRPSLRGQHPASLAATEARATVEAQIVAASQDIAEVWRKVSTLIRQACGETIPLPASSDAAVEVNDPGARRALLAMPRSAYAGGPLYPPLLGDAVREIAPDWWQTAEASPEGQLVLQAIAAPRLDWNTLIADTARTIARERLIALLLNAAEAQWADSDLEENEGEQRRKDLEKDLQRWTPHDLAASAIPQLLVEQGGPLCLALAHLTVDNLPDAPSSECSKAVQKALSRPVDAAVLAARLHLWRCSCCRPAFVLASLVVAAFHGTKPERARYGFVATWLRSYVHGIFRRQGWIDYEPGVWIDLLFTPQPAAPADPGSEGGTPAAQAPLPTPKPPKYLRLSYDAVHRAKLVTDVVEVVAGRIVADLLRGEYDPFHPPERPAPELGDEQVHRTSFAYYSRLKFQSAHDDRVLNNALLNIALKLREQPSAAAGTDIAAGQDDDTAQPDVGLMRTGGAFVPDPNAASRDPWREAEADRLLQEREEATVGEDNAEIERDIAEFLGDDEDDNASSPAAAFLQTSSATNRVTIAEPGGGGN